MARRRRWLVAGVALSLARALKAPAEEVGSGEVDDFDFDDSDFESADFDADYDAADYGDEYLGGYYDDYGDFEGGDIMDLLAGADLPEDFIASLLAGGDDVVTMDDILESLVAAHGGLPPGFDAPDGGPGGVRLVEEEGGSEQEDFEDEEDIEAIFPNSEL